MAKEAEMATSFHIAAVKLQTTPRRAFESHAIKTGIMGGERIAKLNELVRIARNSYDRNRSKRTAHRWGYFPYM